MTKKEITPADLEIELVKKDIGHLASNSDRMEEAMTKIADSSEKMTLMIAQHEIAVQRIEDDNKRRDEELLIRRKELNELLEAIHDRINAQEDHHAEEMVRLDKRIGSVEKWKWLNRGGLAVIVALISLGALIASFYPTP